MINKKEAEFMTKLDFNNIIAYIRRPRMLAVKV